MVTPFSYTVILPNSQVHRVYLRLLNLKLVPHRADIIGSPCIAVNRGRLQNSAVRDVTRNRVNMRAPNTSTNMGTIGEGLWTSIT